MRCGSRSAAASRERLPASARATSRARARRVLSFAHAAMFAASPDCRSTPPSSRIGERRVAVLHVEDGLSSDFFFAIRGRNRRSVFSAAREEEVAKASRPAPRGPPPRRSCPSSSAVMTSPLRLLGFTSSPVRRMLTSSVDGDLELRRSRARARRTRSHARDVPVVVRAETSITRS